jgi:hypothetical protein
MVDLSPGKTTRSDNNESGDFIRLDGFPTIQRRNISQATLQKFGVRRVGETLLVPIYTSNGAKAGVLKRNPPSVEPKYVIEPRVAYGYLYNFHRRRLYGDGPVVVVESPFDVMALDDASIFAVGMIGTSLSPLGLWCLTFLRRPVVLCTDEDSAGFISSVRLSRQLISSGLSVVVYRDGLNLKYEWVAVKNLASELEPGKMMFWRSNATVRTADYSLGC